MRRLKLEDPGWFILIVLSTFFQHCEEYTFILYMTIIASVDKKIYFHYYTIHENSILTNINITLPDPYFAVRISMHA